MAFIPGTTYDIFVTTGQAIFIGETSDPNNPRPPVPGDFNVEVILNSTDGGSFTTAPGYQGLAILSTDVRTLTAAHGDFGIVDSGGNDSITLGDGNTSVLGASGDTLRGGSGNGQFLDAHLGHQVVFAGSSGNETIWGGVGDGIGVVAGANATIAGHDDRIVGGLIGVHFFLGDEFIDGSRGNETILGGLRNTTIWGGPGDSIQANVEGNTTIGGVPTDTILAGPGSADVFIDGSLGGQSIAGGNAGNETI